MKKIKSTVKNAATILICSSKGAHCTWAKYNGKRSVKSLKARLAYERTKNTHASAWVNAPGGHLKENVYLKLNLPENVFCDAKMVTDWIQ